MIIPFIYTLDDDYDTVERIEYIMDSLVVPDNIDSEILFEKIRENGLWSRVEVNCTLNTETGKVEISDVNQVY